MLVLIGRCQKSRRHQEVLWKKLHLLPKGNNGFNAANGCDRPAGSAGASIHHRHVGVKPSSGFCVSRKKPLSPSVFKYTVRMDAHSEPFTVAASHIR